MKPCFYLSNAFLQSFGIGGRAAQLISNRAHSDLNCVETFNFQTAALHHSDGLTKDEIFNSIRSIIQVIGEYASKSQYTLRIDFNIGTLYLGAHRNQFSFNKRLREIVQPSPYEIDNYSEISRGSRLTFSSNHSEVFPQESVSVVSSSGHRSKCSRSAPVASRTDSSENRSASANIYPSRQESAYRAALARHLTELEQRSSEVVKARKEWDEHVKTSALLSELERENRRKTERENAQFLIKQMSESSLRKTTQRNEEIDSINRLMGFPRFKEPPESELKTRLRQSGEVVRRELDNQVHSGKNLRSVELSNDKKIALKMNESSRKELADLRQAEEEKRRTEKGVLRESWDRDIRIKNTWKTLDQYDMLPHSQVGVLLPVMNESNRSQVLGATSKRARSGHVTRKA
jgi:hypothetical protein